MEPSQQIQAVVQIVSNLPAPWVNNKMVKKNKATGPNNIKGELNRALGESKICDKTLQKVFQNIIDRDFKTKSGGKSNTRLIPKVNKPTAKQLTPIVLTDVSYKLFMTIGKKIDAHLLENHEKLDTQEV